MVVTIPNKRNLAELMADNSEIGEKDPAHKKAKNNNENETKKPDTDIKTNENNTINNNDKIITDNANANVNNANSTKNSNDKPTQNTPQTPQTPQHDLSTKEGMFLKLTTNLLAKQSNEVVRKKFCPILQQLVQGDKFLLPNDDIKSQIDEQRAKAKAQIDSQLIQRCFALLKTDYDEVSLPLFFFLFFLKGAKRIAKLRNMQVQCFGLFLRSVITQNK